MSKSLSGIKKRKNDRPFAKRSLGQNFLVDKNCIRKIVESLGPLDRDLVVEVGPGRGALTKELAAQSGGFVAIELDRVFAQSLREKYSDSPGIEIYEEDVLSFDFAKLEDRARKFESTKIVGNLPYNISTAVLETLASANLDFAFAVFMFQKEVVSRITAMPKNSSRGYLTVITEANFETSFLFDVHPKSFKPVPRVNSAVVRLSPRKAEGISNPELFKRLVSEGFRQKRKTIQNNFKSGRLVEDAVSLLKGVGIDPGLRPDALTLDDWIALTSALDVSSRIEN